MVACVWECLMIQHLHLEGFFLHLFGFEAMVEVIQSDLEHYVRYPIWIWDFRDPFDCLLKRVADSQKDFCIRF